GVMVEAAKLAPRQNHDLALVYEREKERKCQSSDAGRSSEDGGVSARRGSGATRFRTVRRSAERSGLETAALPGEKTTGSHSAQTARSCGCRLSDGDQTPEALFELFQDWQRTYTQSFTVSGPCGPSQKRMSGSAKAGNHRREAHVRAAGSNSFNS